MSPASTRTRKGAKDRRYGRTYIDDHRNRLYNLLRGIGVEPPLMRATVDRNVDKCVGVLRQ